MKGSVTALGVTLCIAIFAAAGVLASEKPSIDLDWYGFVKLDAAYDNNLTSHGNFSMWVQQQQYGKDDEQFNMTANQTRLGFNATGNGYDGVTVAGKLEFDLYGGVSGATIAENKAMLQLRHAYFTIQSDEFRLLAGQSYDLISPLNPSTLNYPVLWGCGNIGYRRPQVSFWYTANPSSQNKVTIAGGFFRTIGSDLTPTFTLALGEASEDSDDGTDAGIPSFQGLLDITHELSTGGTIRAGVSGLWGQLKAETNQGNSETYESWAAAGHLDVSLNPSFGFAGEAFIGSNLGSYYGGILNGSRIAGVATKGGWGLLWVKPTEDVKLSGGGGMDDPDDADLSNSDRAQNLCLFANIEYSIVPQVTVGLELSHWETKYKNADAVKNIRAQSAFILNF